MNGAGSASAAAVPLLRARNARRDAVRPQSDAVSAVVAAG
jgi:hypothetical protein